MLIDKLFTPLNHAIFRKSDRRKISLLVAAIFMSTTLEAIGIAGIFPIMKVVFPDQNTNPEVLRWFGIDMFEFRDVILPLYFSIFVIAATFKLLILYMQNSVVYNFEAELSNRVLNRYLFSSYETSRDASSSHVAKMALSEVSAIIQNYILPLVNLASNTLLVSLIVLVLLIADFWNTLIILTVLLTTYVLIILIAKSKLALLSQLRTDSNEQRFQAIGDAITNLKSVKVFGIENSRSQIFDNAAKSYADATIKAAFINTAPRIVVETIIFIISLSVIAIFLNGNDILTYIPLITLYLFASLRLLPAMQKLYSSISHLRYAEKLMAQFDDSFKFDVTDCPDTVKNRKAKFCQSIRIESLSYLYDRAGVGLENINLEIEKGKKAVIIGRSGSGKSTLVNCLLNLNTLHSGRLLLDGNELKKQQFSDFYNLVGYVPQNAAFFHSTLRYNVTLCQTSEQDDQKIWDILAIVGLDEVVQGLNNGLEEQLTGNDCALSGGELQRLSIARALYRAPEILIFDEATSALDKETATLIDKIIHSPEYTVINVTHNTKDLAKYDYIFELVDGKIK